MLLQMLMATGDIAVWADTLVTILSAGEQRDLTLRCFIQLLESHHLIDNRASRRPARVGRVA